MGQKPTIFPITDIYPQVDEPLFGRSISNAKHLCQTMSATVPSPCFTFTLCGFNLPL